MERLCTMDDGSRTWGSFEKETLKGRKNFQGCPRSLGLLRYAPRRSDGLINGQKSLQSAPHSRSLAHHDEEDEVEPVPEGVRVLHEVHDVGPALETDYLNENTISW